MEIKCVTSFSPETTPHMSIRVSYCETQLTVVPKYNYLGIYWDQYLSFDDCTRVISYTAGRALGGVINQFKEIQDTIKEIWVVKHFRCMKLLS